MNCAFTCFLPTVKVVFFCTGRSETRNDRKESFSLWDPAFGVHDVIRECHTQLHETQIPQSRQRTRFFTRRTGYWRCTSLTRISHWSRVGIMIRLHSSQTHSWNSMTVARRNWKDVEISGSGTMDLTDGSTGLVPVWVWWWRSSCCRQSYGSWCISSSVLFHIFVWSWSI